MRRFGLEDPTNNLNLLPLFAVAEARIDGAELRLAVVRRGAPLAEIRIQ